MNADDFRARLDSIRTSLIEITERAGRSEAVTLVAVSKTVELERIREAIDAGQCIFGENRVQEALAKMDALGDKDRTVTWHLVGHVQSNKVKSVIGRFQCVQSVDSFRLATELNWRAEEAGVSCDVLLEVNVARESSKSGFDPETLQHQVGAILELSGLRVLGLMTIAPLVPDPEDVRWVFRALRELRDNIREQYGVDHFSQLSMGMSNDYEVAVEEGATMVRIGRALFGDRQTAPRVRQT
jgi:pyridoxal phosphate enzyme (YggS family)